MRLISTLGPKGQLLLPSSVRRALGLSPGDKVQFRRTTSGEYVVEAAEPLAHDQTALLSGGRPPLDERADRARMHLSRAERAERGLRALRGGDASEEPY